MEKKIYNFSWIDKELKKKRSLQEQGSYASEQSDSWVVDQFTYPHCIFHYMMPDVIIECDMGGNDFHNDRFNYLQQLYEYKEKYEMKK